MMRTMQVRTRSAQAPKPKGVHARLRRAKGGGELPSAWHRFDPKQAALPACPPLDSYLPAMPRRDGLKPPPMVSQTATLGLADLRFDTASSARADIAGGSSRAKNRLMQRSKWHLHSITSSARARRMAARFWVDDQLDFPLLTYFPRPRPYPGVAMRHLRQWIASPRSRN